MVDKSLINVNSLISKNLHGNQGKYLKTRLYYKSVLTETFLLEDPLYQ